MLFKITKFKVSLIVIVMIFSGFAIAVNAIEQTSSGFNVIKTASVPQNSLTSQYSNGFDPFAGAYDPYNQEIYIANSGGHNVTVKNAFTNVTVANVTVGSSPNDITYVPYNHDLYVDNYGSSNISVISSVTNKVVATFSTPGNPQYSIYDPQCGTLFVTGSANSASVLLIISVLNNTVVSAPSLPIDAGLSGLAFDPFNGFVYVADSNNNVVYAFTSSGNIVATIATGQNPTSVAFDPVNRMLYVTDYDTNALLSGVKEYNVTIINTAINTFVKNVVPGSKPNGITYDPVNGYIYISNYGSGNISVLGPLTQTIIQTISESGTEPTSMVYDPVLQQMISLGVNGQTTTLNYNSAGGYAQQLSSSPNAQYITYDPVNRLLYVAAGAYDYINVYSLNGTFLLSIPTPAPVKSVLYANGTVYATVDSYINGKVAFINPSNNTIFRNVTLANSYPDGLAYDSLNNTLFVANEAGNSILVVNLSSDNAVQILDVGSQPAALTYSSATNQVYVAESDSNIHIINASSYVNIYPNIVAGSDPSQVVYDPYTNSIYIANYGNNSMFVINESKIDYNANGDTPFSTFYLGGPQQGIAFDPSNGLIYIMQADTNNVSIFNPQLKQTVGSISAASISGGFSGGSYLTYIPGAQIILAANSDGYIDEIAPAQTYGVSVSVGKMVPQGATWNLQIQPSSDSAFARVYESQQLSNQTVVLPLPDGTYSLNISTSYGGLMPTHTFFVVSGASKSLVYYTQYEVNFTETGLPLGSNWSVTLGNDTGSSSTNDLTFKVLAGNYTAYIHQSASYEAYPSSLNLTTENGNVSVSVFYQSALNQTYGAISQTVNLTGNLTYSGDSYFPANPRIFSSLGAYDPSIGLLMTVVLSKNNNVIDVYNLSSGYLLANSYVPVNNPESAYFDPFNSMFYVVGQGTNNFAAIYPPNGTVEYTLALPGNLSYAMAATQAGVFVMNSTGTVFEISAAGSLMKEYSVTNGTYLSPITMIPYGGNLFFLNETGNSLVKLNITTSSVTSYPLPVSGFNPIQVISGMPGTLYISSRVDNYLEIFNEATDKFTGSVDLTDSVGGTTITANNATSGVYDPANGLMYFSTAPGSLGDSSAYFFVINPHTNAVISSFPGFGNSSSLFMIYVPSDQTVYSTSIVGDVLTVISPQKYYDVTVTERGLPSGTSWALKLSNGTTFTTSGTSITFSAENDTQYTYTLVSGNSSYGGTPGNFILSGGPGQAQANFTLLKYAVDIKESGLSPGTEWFVKINGTTYNSTTDQITVQLPNGTYSYSVLGVGGYTLTNSSGNVSVKGGATVTVKFNRIASGFPTIDYAIIGGVVGLAGIGGASVYIVRLRSRK